MELDNIKTTGIYWLKEEVKNKNGETEFYVWWGICKETRKVAFMRGVISNLYAMLPMIMNDIYFSNNHCDDGKYCLNLDCPYSTNTKLIDSIIQQHSFYGDEDMSEENVVDYFERSIKFIMEEFLGKMPEEELNKIFVEDYAACTVNENAFVTTRYGDGL